VARSSRLRCATARHARPWALGHNPFGIENDLIEEKGGEQIRGGGGDAAAGPVVVGAAGFHGIHRGGHLGGFQLLAFAFEFFHFVGAGGVHAAGADEFHDAAEFIFVEPSAVRAADVHHHAGAVREHDAVHERVANGAWDVADIFFNIIHGRGPGSRSAEDGGLLLAISADFLERGGIGPDAFALGAFAQVGGADDDGIHADLATGAKLFYSRGNFCAREGGAAVGTEFCAGKDHPETRWARDDGEARAAVRARGGVRRHGCAARGAVHGFGGGGHMKRLSGIKCFCQSSTHLAGGTPALPGAKRGDAEGAEFRRDLIKILDRIVSPSDTTLSGLMIFSASYPG